MFSKSYWHSVGHQSLGLGEMTHGWVFGTWQRSTLAISSARRRSKCIAQENWDTCHGCRFNLARLARDMLWHRNSRATSPECPGPWGPSGMVEVVLPKQLLLEAQLTLGCSAWQSFAENMSQCESQASVTRCQWSLVTSDTCSTFAEVPLPWMSGEVDLGDGHEKCAA